MRESCWQASVAPNHLQAKGGRQNHPKFITRKGIPLPRLPPVCQSAGNPCRRSLAHQETLHSEVLEESLALHEGGGILHLPEDWGPLRAQAIQLNIYLFMGSICDPRVGIGSLKFGFRRSWDLSFLEVDWKPHAVIAPSISSACSISRITSVISTWSFSAGGIGGDFWL